MSCCDVLDVAEVKHVMLQCVEVAEVEHVMLRCVKGS